MSESTVVDPIVALPVFTDAVNESAEGEAQEAPKDTIPNLSLADRIATEKERLLQHMISVNRDIRESQSNYEQQKQLLKSAKETLDYWHTKLSNLVNELEDVDNGQLGLPFKSVATSAVHDPEPESTSVDPATTTPLAELTISKGHKEKLAEAGCKTVADIEGMMQRDELRDVSGIGEAAVDKISDAILGWRDKHGYGQTEEDDENENDDDSDSEEQW